MRKFLLPIILTLVVVGASPAGAQERPTLEPGVATYVSIVDSIVIDGDLSDWTSLPTIITSTGPTLPADPANTGSVTWQVATVGQTLVFSATVVDATIIAGQHGENYWNEDSLELYVNFSGDRQVTSYRPGIAQITFSPVDIGNADPAALTITGNNASDVSISGFVFATADGWGVEAALSLDGLAVPVDRGEFGLQVHANGSSGGDRDTKLIWSIADVNDSSFSDPSVFGTGVFVDEINAAPVDEPATDASVDTAVAVDDVTVETDEPASGVSIDDLVAEVLPDESVAPVVAVEEPKSRTLLIAAVFSAASIMLGGFWFEHRRKADEERRAAAVREATAEQLALGPADLEGSE
jgi:hypothetical protein